MPINHYHGINPHLNDHLVTTRYAWEEFHGYLITEMALQMHEQLYPLGYEATTQPGLQFRVLDPDSGEPEARSHPERPEPDIALLYKRSQPIPPKPKTPAHASVNLIDMPLPWSLEESQRYLPGIRIRKRAERLPGTPGEPIVWIELLSPSNKPSAPHVPQLQGRHAPEYANKRFDVLEANQVLVEIDFHQAQPPVIKGLPRYQRGPQHQPPEPDAWPYYISISDPRPSPGYDRGRVGGARWGIESPLPTIRIPLLGQDELKFDFDPPYDVIVSRRYPEIDYARRPALWHSYNDRDQDLISARMETLFRDWERISAKQKVPLPLSVPVQDARLRIEQLEQDIRLTQRRNELDNTLDMDL